MNYDSAPLNALEPNQRREATAMPLPRKKLARGTRILLAMMRIYVMIAIPLVFYAFFHALRTG